MKRTKKPTKPAAAYSREEIMATAIYGNLTAALPSLAESEACRLTRAELGVKWTELNQSKVNKLVDAFRGKLAALGITGKTLKITTVTDSHGNTYYDVRSEAGGRKHGRDELLPKGYLAKKRAVTALAD